MTTTQIDQLNILLLVVAGGLSFYFPFEVFLFSFVVLGPLHYLTEISWLSKRDFFLQDSVGIKWLVTLCTLSIICVYGFRWEQGMGILVGAALIASVYFTYQSAWRYRFLVVACLVSLCMLLSFQNWFVVFFALLLPTIIHTIIFTVFFMLAGSMRSRSVWGFVATILFLVITIALVTVPIASPYSTTAYALNAINSTPNFTRLYELSHHIFFSQPFTVDGLFTTPAGWAVSRFIAFIYTYHYLNWFSKTTVIKWHDVPRELLVFTIGIWLLSVALYSWRMVTGINVLFYLALLHAFLEFPLNIITIKNVVASTFSIARKQTPAR